MNPDQHLILWHRSSCEPRKSLVVTVETTGSPSSDYNSSGSDFIIRTQIYTWTGRGEDETPFNVSNINTGRHLGGLSGKLLDIWIWSQKLRFRLEIRI